LEILLALFYWSDQLIDTRIRFEGIDLPSVYLAELADKRFDLSPEQMK
jgi:hypothetical protein